MKPSVLMAIKDCGSWRYVDACECGFFSLFLQEGLAGFEYALQSAGPT